VEVARVTERGILQAVLLLEIDFRNFTTVHVHLGVAMTQKGIAAR